MKNTKNRYQINLLLKEKTKSIQKTCIKNYPYFVREYVKNKERFIKKN